MIVSLKDWEVRKTRDFKFLDKTYIDLKNILDKSCVKASFFLNTPSWISLFSLKLHREMVSRFMSTMDKDRPKGSRFESRLREFKEVTEPRIEPFSEGGIDLCWLTMDLCHNLFLLFLPPLRTFFCKNNLLFHLHQHRKIQMKSHSI